jgi:3-deoxy-D-manno-octulosonic-acid transferase
MPATTNIPLQLALFVYSCIMEAAGLIAVILLHWSSLSRKWNIRERTDIPAGAPSARPAVWLHAASLGEAKLLVRFLEVLRSKHPGQKYLITATTRSGVDYLRRVKGEDICSSGFLPLDSFRLMRSLVETHNVSRLWLLETELWPCMLWTCFSKGIPVGLVNARLEEDSLRRYRRFGWLWIPLFRTFDRVLAQNRVYADRFERLGVSASRIGVTGNLKRHVAIQPLPLNKRTELKRKIGLAANDRCITAGCIHPGEGVVLAAALASLNEMSCSVKCIVVPRHLRDGDALAKELGPDVVRIKGGTTVPDWTVCIVEKMGILEKLYGIADAAIVGGTFDATGGHNMWDAAQFGIPVIFGPNFRTQQESGEALIAAGVAFCANDARGLAERIASILSDDAGRFAAARQTFAKATNDSNHNLEELIP